MSKLIADRVLPWRRFWVSWKSHISRGSDGRGFLDDPEDEFYRQVNPKLFETEELLEHKFLVLSGPPGIGKTIEFERLKTIAGERLQRQDALIGFHCRCIGSDDSLYRETVGSTKWKQAIADGSRVTLLIDGVDEGLSRVPVMVEDLTHWLKTEPIDRVQVVLVCRAASWDESAGAELQNLWPGGKPGGVFELCPLRQCDAELAARNCGFETSRFVEYIYQQQLTGLAARPLTLRMLLGEYKKDRCFSTSHRTLFETAARRMCEEIDPDRARRLRSCKPASNQIFQVTCRIAASLMLCGRNTVLRSSQDQPQETDLTYSDILLGDEIVDGQTFVVTEELLDAALDTPLFSFRGPSRYGFDHQTFAELMAAHYVQDAPLYQLRKLLCQEVDGTDLVVPQLAETAAWLSLQNADFCEFLIATQPEILLRADMTMLDPNQKVRAVASLLDRVDREEAFDERANSLFFPSLRHDNLGNQLRPYIIDQSRNLVVRRMAIEIAGVAQANDLEDVLWETLRAEQNDVIRRRIGAALGELADAKSEGNLRRLLAGEFGPDPDLDLRGTALQALVPKYASVSDVLTHLNAPADHSYVGTYYLSVRYHLPQHIKRNDLLPLLGFMKAWPACFDSTSMRRGLAEKAFSMALDNLEDRNVSRFLVEMWRTKVRNHQELPSWEPDSYNNNLPPDYQEKRLFFVRVVLNDANTISDDVKAWKAHIVDRRDVEWLLQQILEAPLERRKVWAEVISFFAFSDEMLQNSELLEQRYQEIPELRECLPSPTKYSIGTTLDRLRQAARLKSARREKKWARESRQMSRREALDYAFRVLESGDSRGWLDVARNVYAEDSGDTIAKDDISCIDITSSPGWRSMSESEIAIAHSAAKRFLLEYAEGPRRPDQFTNYGRAGFYAIWLLRHEVESDPALRNRVTERWLPAIIDTPSSGESRHQELVSLAYRLDPVFTRQRLVTNLIDDDAGDNCPQSLRKFEQCWNSDLTRAALHFLMEQNIKPRTLRGVLGFLAVRDQTRAIEITDKLLARALSEERFSSQTRALVIAAMFYLPESFWRRLWPVLCSASVHDARAAFLESIVELTDRDSHVLEELSDSQVADLFLLLMRLFPPEEYSERSDASGNVAARHQIPDFRERCLGVLVNRATAGSCQEIERVVSELPREQAIWIKWRHMEAVRIRVRKSWAQSLLSPQEMLKLLQSHARRIIASDGDLLDAVCDSLDRLRQQLHRGEFPPVRALWNEPSLRSKDKPSPKEETALSDFLNDWFRKDLGVQSGVIINREVQTKRFGRLDLKIEAITLSEESVHCVVVLEVKRDSHADIRWACRTQLVDRYLRGEARRHGVYLVGLFGGEDSFWKTPGQANAEVGDWVRAAAGTDYQLRAEILDCRLHIDATSQ